MKVLLFCCKGFETMEFAPFVDVMGWARNDYGMSAEVVTAGFSKTVVSAFGIPVLVDKIYDEIKDHKKARNNPNWKAKVRQTLQMSPYCVNKARGVWAYAA